MAPQTTGLGIVTTDINPGRLHRTVHRRSSMAWKGQDVNTSTKEVPPSRHFTNCRPPKFIQFQGLGSLCCPVSFPGLYAVQERLGVHTQAGD